MLEVLDFVNVSIVFLGFEFYVEFVMVGSFYEFFQLYVDECVISFS